MIGNSRFEDILSRFKQVKLAVLGDFFLDLYIDLDRSLSELSLETHKEAFQAVDLRGQAGAAGVVAKNIASLGAQTAAVGYTGRDGNGFTLRSALRNAKVTTDYLIEWQGRFTPTYTKPMMKEVDAQIGELNRIDVINRTPNPTALNQALLKNLTDVLSAYEGILVLEQVKNDNFGTLSPLLRKHLSELTVQYPNKVIIVDSRSFSDKYQGLSLKMNLSEAVKAARNIDPKIDEKHTDDKLRFASTCSQILWERNRKPIFITLGEEGICGFSDGEFFLIPGYKTEGPVDIVGAGDAVLAAIGLAQCAGAESREAAYIGNLVGSIIVQQIGTTGFVTHEQLRHRHKEYQTSIS